MQKQFKIKPYEQQTFLSCLSAAFLMIRNGYENTQLTKENEMKYFVNALNSVKGFYQFGFFVDAEKEGYETGIITEVPDLHKYLVALKEELNTNTKITLQHIDIKFIKNFFIENNSPLVLFVDQWPFSMHVRTQHYIILTGFEDGFINIVEPWYGKEMKIPESTLQASLNSLRNNLLCGAQILYIKK